MVTQRLVALEVGDPEHVGVIRAKAPIDEVVGDPDSLLDMRRKP